MSKIVTQKPGTSISPKTRKAVGEFMVESFSRPFFGDMVLSIVVTKIDPKNLKSGIGWITDSTRAGHKRGLRYVVEGTWEKPEIYQLNHLMEKIKEEMPEDVYEEFESQVMMMILEYGGP